MNQFKFQISECGEGSMPGVFGVSKERGDILADHFREVHGKHVGESVIDSCKILSDMTSCAQNDDELHYCIYASGCMVVHLGQVQDDPMAQLARLLRKAMQNS